MSQTLLEYARQHRGVVFNLVFIAYVALAQPLLLTASTAVFVNDAQNPLLGLALAVILVGETFALHWKFRAVNQRTQTSVNSSSHFGALVPIWVGHMVIVVILGMAFLQSWGIRMDAEAPSGWAAVLLIGLVLREIILFLWYGASRSTDSPPVRARTEFFADVLLTLFACIAYTAIWETIAGATPLSQYSGAELVLQAVMAALLFVILFVPMRFGFLYEELMTSPDKRGTRAIVLSTAITTIFVIGSLL